MRRWGWAGVIIGISLVAGCGASTPNRTVATLGTEKITHAQLDQFIAINEAIRNTSLPQSRQAKKAQLMALIEQDAVVQWALSHHVITENQADRKARHFAVSSLISAGLPHRLQKHQVSSTEWTHYLSRQMIIEAALERVTQKLTPPSLGQERAEYAMHPAKYTTPTSVLVRDITVHSKGDAQSIIDQIHKGSSFVALAQKDSLDADRMAGGSRGWIPLGVSGVLPGNWNKPVARLKPGQLCIVKGPVGYSILEVQASRAGALIPFQTVQGVIKAELQQLAKANAFDVWARHLMAGMKVHLSGRL